MAYSLSPNLKLRIDSNLTANAKYNLLKLDELGSLAATSSASGTVQLKSQYDLFLNANDPDQGGTGRGGNIILGSPDNQLDSIVMNATRIVVNGGFGFFDQSVIGTNQEASSLSISYFSALSGTLDPSDVTLKLDLDNQDRSLILGGDLSIYGTLQLTAASGGSSVQFPAAGTLATLSGAESLTNKTLDATQNTIRNLGLQNLVDGFQLPGSQVLANFSGQNVRATSLTLPAGSRETCIQGAPSGQLANLTFTLPPSTGLSGQVLTTDGTGSLTWTDKSATNFSASSQATEFTVGVSQDTRTGAVSLSLDKSPQQPNLVWIGPAAGAAERPTFRKLARQDVSHLVGNSMSVTWLPSQGAELTIQHNWGTRSVIVQIFDNQQWEGLDGPTVRRVDLNTVRILSRFPPPAGGWTVLLQAVLS